MVMSTPLQQQPDIVERPAQPYVAVRGAVTMQTIGAVADRIGEIFEWLAARGIEPVGAPFLRYNVIDMDRRLEIEAGVPIADAVAGDGDVSPGVLPAGRYATVTHVGHPDDLIDVTAALLDWAAERGLEWDTSHTEDGQWWGCRLEVYNTDPAVEPDISNWETELMFRLAG